MRRFRVWSDFWKKYATEAELYMDGSADAVFEDDSGVPHHENTDLVVEFKTGLKDKNGKEIYEGDIVSEEFEYGGEKTKTIWQVRWCDDECGFELHYVSGFEVDDCSLVADDEENCEVIGNVHENGELLEEEK